MTKQTVIFPANLIAPPTPSTTSNFNSTMPASTLKPVLLPVKGTARVKNIVSGDTVVLWGKASAPGLAPPHVQFTLEGLMAPRYVSAK